MDRVIMDSIGLIISQRKKKLALFCLLEWEASHYAYCICAKNEYSWLSEHVKVKLTVSA